MKGETRMERDDLGRITFSSMLKVTCVWRTSVLLSGFELIELFVPLGLISFVECFLCLGAMQHRCWHSGLRFSRSVEFDEQRTRDLRRGMRLVGIGLCDVGNVIRRDSILRSGDL